MEKSRRIIDSGDTGTAEQFLKDELFDRLSFEGRMIIKQGKVVQCSDQVSVMTGYPPDNLAGMEVNALFLSDVFSPADDETEKYLNRDAVILRSDGTEKKVFVRTMRAGDTYYLTFIPADMLKVPEKVDSRQHRLMTSGVIAAGVAHEVNNPLTGMINFGQLIYDHTESEKLKRYAWSIIKEGNRIGKILRNLLNYSNYRENREQLIHPSEIINDAVSLLKSTFRAEFIIVRVKNTENVPSGVFNNQELEQVLINLLLNARDSLNKKYPDYHRDKLITISLNLEQEKGQQFVVFEVSDRGEGISDEHLERIFESGFTTRETGGNSGLGLALCRDIVEAHNGRLEVRSVPEEGAAFRVFIPFKK